jgi:cytochrome c peroxidase
VDPSTDLSGSGSTDSPTLRGNHDNLLFSLKRSIRSTDHFSEVEEYFDGDISLQLQIGGRQLDKASTNRMGDFNAILDFPPAPKLGPLMKLIPEKATPAELNGEKLFERDAASAIRPRSPPDNLMSHCMSKGLSRGRKDGPKPFFPAGHPRFTTLLPRQSTSDAGRYC